MLFKFPKHSHNISGTLTKHKKMVSLDNNIPYVRNTYILSTYIFYKLRNDIINTINIYILQFTKLYNTYIVYFIATWKLVNNS